jgi:hypothetical protein
MNLFTMQAIIDKVWTLDDYNATFLANKLDTRDFQHAFEHCIKALGKISGYLDYKAHKNQEYVDIRPYVADLLIAIARMANTKPEGHIALEYAVRERLTQKFSTDMSRFGIGRVVAERARQVEEEGFDENHDDEYDDCELAKAAFCYFGYGVGASDEFIKRAWPWDVEWFKPQGRLRNLEKAGALNLAEIERLVRINDGIYGEIDEILENKQK